MRKTTKAKTWTTVPADALQARVVEFMEEHRLGGDDRFDVEANGDVLLRVKSGPVADLAYGARQEAADALRLLAARSGYRLAIVPGHAWGAWEGATVTFARA